MFQRPPAAAGHPARPRLSAACRWALRLATAAALLWPLAASAHPGDLDEYGGHFNERAGGYHYHRPAWDMAERTKDYLNWAETGARGEMVGVVVEVDRPDAVWLHIPYRPAFQNLAAYVSSQNRDDEQARVRVWFDHVSPERSVRTQGAEYLEWFRQKVVYELDRKLRGQQVTVQFQVAPASQRVQGMLLLGEENINLWLVLNGWSFYLLGADENPHEQAFQEAEQIARAAKEGLWGR